jgi:hypothetical protein
MLEEVRVGSFDDWAEKGKPNLPTEVGREFERMEEMGNEFV